MNIVQMPGERSKARAVALVNQLWDRTPVIPQSCRGLLDAVNNQLGEELEMATDATGGNDETIRMMWANLLGFLRISPAEYERAKEALARCGPQC